MLTWSYMFFFFRRKLRILVLTAFTYAALC